MTTGSNFPKIYALEKRATMWIGGKYSWLERNLDMCNRTRVFCGLCFITCKTEFVDVEFAQFISIYCIVIW